MIALLLNSGLGSRMGDETREHPKCMCRLTEQETIISWQVKLLRHIGVMEAVVTTGHLADTLIAYLESLDSGIRFHFVHNPKYRETNYIYSMYLARNLLRGQDSDNAKQCYLSITCKIQQSGVYLLGSADSYGAIYVPFGDTWVAGKRHIYTLIFGGGYTDQGEAVLNPIQFDAETTGWVDADNKDVNVKP